MSVSLFELFKIGIGPSSSHTVGPMKAARRFVRSLAERGQLDAVAGVRVEFFGSLALTGRGHASDRAVVLGLMGETPEQVAVDDVPAIIESLRVEQRLRLLGRHPVAFIAERDLLFRCDQTLPRHPNGMRLEAFDIAGGCLAAEEFYSVGGGFVVSAEEWDQPPPAATRLPFAYSSAEQLLALGRQSGLSIAAMARANEEARRPAAEVEAGLARLWAAMQDCVRRGLAAEGPLPGGLAPRRRAAALRARLEAGAPADDPLAVLGWLHAFALAVGEENAAGGRVVTAPTNGAAGIVPAVGHYLWRFVPGTDQATMATFLLTAAAIGALYKENASISGAEVGCQGEVGVACSMAAAGLAAAQGGSNAQVENAAEIGMEHHLGLTCDPVGGLVQVPCIERNAIAAATAITAARMSLAGDGHHVVSLDAVIATMRQTGADMQAKYKETSLGGLAVNVVEC
jgi:L-serine dehydratase